ncbi:ABC transporter substrate-binding protein [Rhodococcus sp. IEGM 1379]|uniref:taurine ABC transporter substrate-binding protein n=1 Tax=Rhodococcus sp. IEGM 1379 TaxID=3047086 RepID=UPI0024B6BB3E|nr:ABC transporter substrate-binding protein [Rhodococcus sp. IEGM 1379]MDI9917230.1 ABC transporter substrate-binding protein [Rhodococcus sp. IEGM 1379]
MISSSGRTAIAVMTAAALGATLTACVETGRGEVSRSMATSVTCPVAVDESVTTSASIGYQDIPNGDLIVKDQGLLEACMPNADITWSKFSSGQDVVQAFGSGSLDLGTLGSSPATMALSAPLNIPMQVVWIQDVIGEAESLVVKDPAITTLEGLRGKKIATPFGSTSHYSLLAALGAANLAADVTLMSLKPDAMLGAWQGGQIDAAWVWDPTLSKLTADGHVIMSSADVSQMGAPTFDLSGATTEFVSANPEFMVMWTKLQDYAAGRINADPTGAAVSMSAQLGIAPDLITPQLVGYTYLSAADQASNTYLGGDFAQSLSGTAKFLLEQGNIDAVSPTSAYVSGIYTDAVKKVGQP